ncbi:MAG: ester cyclase [Anaerolineae bacterium]
MSTEQNKTAVLRTFNEAWNEKKLAMLREVIAEGAVYYNPSTPQPLLGPEGQEMFIGGFHVAFPDTHFTIEDVVAEGDKVVVRWAASGTNQGPLMGMPATGKRVTVRGMTMFTVRDGMVQESWTNWDTLAMLQQLGIVPMPQS